MLLELEIQHIVWPFLSFIFRSQGVHVSQFSLAKTSPKVLAITAALVLGTGAVTAAYAASTTAGEIRGCYNVNNGGQLRVLAPGQTCDLKKETAISWNTQGIQGEAGPQGIPGLDGAPGAQGPQGEKGDTGDTGATGAQGEKGDTGATGATGATGPVGPAGPQGATGATGATGAAASTSVSVVTATGTTVSVTASCTGGKIAVGGGYSLNAAGNNGAVSSLPVMTGTTPTGWTVTQKNTGTMTVYVTCIQ